MTLSDVTAYFDDAAQKESLLHQNLKQLDEAQDYLINISSLQELGKAEDEKIMQQLLNLQYAKRAIRDLLEAYENKELKCQEP